MALRKFSKKEAIKFGWRTMKKNLAFFIGLLIVTGLLYSVSTIIAKLWPERDFFASLIIMFVGWALAIIVSTGLIKIGLKFCDDEKPRLLDLFSQYRLFFKFLFGLILYYLIFLGGLILLIIPGIIWGIKFSFFGFFIIDQGLGPIQALKKSSAITKGNKRNLFLLFLLFGLINFFGVICLLVGLFATIPVTILAQAFVYRKLNNQYRL